MGPVTALHRLCRPLQAVLLGVALLGQGSGALVAAEPSTFKEKVTGAELPKQVSFTHRGKTYTLQATGSAVRRKWFTNGYVIGHYSQNPVKGSQGVVLKDIFSGDKPKQMMILWLHRLPAKLIKESFKESLSRILGPPETGRLKDNIEKLVSFFKSDAEVQDKYSIRWLPGGQVEVYYNDEKTGSMIDVDLARALWSIWLGPESVVDRQDMLQFVIIK